MIDYSSQLLAEHFSCVLRCQRIIQLRKQAAANDIYICLFLSGAQTKKAGESEMIISSVQNFWMNSQTSIKDDETAHSH